MLPCGGVVVSGPVPSVSVVVPARNEGGRIAATVGAIRAQAVSGLRLEVIVVDDGSTDDTAEAARAAGARVIDAPRPRNPAAARNAGAHASHGDPIVFLDADCTPQEGWLAALLAAHDRGEAIVGGALDLPPGLPPSARCDYWAGWYLVHSGRPGGPVPHHPPPNLSVRRAVFFATSGFREDQPFAYTNEERRWQGEARKAGHRIWFEPGAAALHWNRPGFSNLLRRHYRWGYTAIPAKAESGAARFPWLYRRPWAAILAGPLLAVAHTGYIQLCWLRAGRFEPLGMGLGLFAARLAWTAGMTVGGLRWMWGRGREGVG